VVTYSLSCLTKHSGRYWVLMVGRLLGGVSTSLLFSAFESWLVAEHNKRGFPSAVLGDVFSKAVFLGAGLMAIVSGLLGNVLVETLRLGPVAPFDAAIAVMLLGAAVIVPTWTENYGDNAHHSLLQQLTHGWKAIRTGRGIFGGFHEGGGGGGLGRLNRQAGGYLGRQVVGRLCWQWAASPRCRRGETPK
jgi:hypothetical protein